MFLVNVVDVKKIFYVQENFLFFSFFLMYLTLSLSFLRHVVLVCSCIHTNPFPVHMLCFASALHALKRSETET